MDREPLLPSLPQGPCRFRIMRCLNWRQRRYNGTECVLEPGMQHRITAAAHPLHAEWSRRGMNHGQQLRGAASGIVVRLPARLPLRAPALACLRYGLIRPGLLLRPHRQPVRLTEPLGLLDQFFFAAVSGACTKTILPFRLRHTVPVAHQVRCCCQRKPAAVNTCQLV